VVVVVAASAGKVASKPKKIFFKEEEGEVHDMQCARGSHRWKRKHRQEKSFTDLKPVL
jgi:hypothetical protein